VVVGLFVDAVGDFLVVLVTHAVLVGGLVDLCRQKLALLDFVRRDVDEETVRLLTCLSAKPWALSLP
jgi:hypothetical protein